MSEEKVIQISKEEEDLSNEISQRYTYTSGKYSPWDMVAKEDYSYGLGDQWKEEDKQALEKEGRPVLTFNRIRPVVSLISGYQRENSSRIKVNPEGGEDRIFSEVWDRGIKHVGKVAHLPHKMGYWFDDGLFCGKGWLEGVLRYDKDPIRGQLDFKQRTPYQIMPDPDFIEYDLNDGCRYCFKVVRVPKSEMKELYPEKEALIQGFSIDNEDMLENGSGAVVFEGDADNYGNNPNKVTIVKSSDNQEDSGLKKDDKFTIKEYWYIKMVKKWFVIDKESGEPERFDTEEEANARVTEQDFGKAIDRKVPEMWVAAKCCGFILQNELSPFEPFYSGYPFFRYMADWAPNAETETLRVQGIVRPLKDPQKEKNKSKSSYLHILSTQANTGWIGDDDALSPDGWKELEKRGSKPGITLKKKKGSELREIQSKTAGTGHIQREEKADEEFKHISLVNADLMGLQDGTESGKAIGMRIKQAILGLVRLFANYRYSKEILGKFILDMTPMLFDAKKLKKILGPQYMKSAVDKEKYPEGLTEGVLEGFLTVVKDNRYDVFVTEADQNATIRYEIFQELSQLLQAGAPIPVSLLIDYMDLPNSEEVKEKIKEEQERISAAAQAEKKK